MHHVPSVALSAHVRMQEQCRDAHEVARQLVQRLLVVPLKPEHFSQLIWGEGWQRLGTHRGGSAALPAHAPGAIQAGHCRVALPICFRVRASHRGTPTGTCGLKGPNVPCEAPSRGTRLWCARRLAWLRHLNGTHGDKMQPAKPGVWEHLHDLLFSLDERARRWRWVHVWPCCTCSPHAPETLPPASWWW